MTTAGIDLRELNAFVDGELDLRRQLEVEAMVAANARLQAEVERLRELRRTVHEHGQYHAVPEELRRRLMALGGHAPGRQKGALTGERLPAQAWSRVVGARIGWRRVAAMMLAAALFAGFGGVLAWRAAEQDRRVNEVIGSHVRATLSQRVVDVASSDQHTVKPWLSARLDFSPPVHELPGVVFAGGRLDYLDGRPVAVLVYRRRAHVIDVFIEPTTWPDEPMRLDSQRGFQVVRDVREGMRYWIVSDLNAKELRDFVRTLAAADAAR